jgi:sugar lactone lactonase YvrE
MDNHRVRRLDLQTNTLSTFAGSGEQGYSGDAGPARQAALNQPYELRFDERGGLYIVEMQNHIVRYINAGTGRPGSDAETGVISTVAGSGRPGFAGDGGPALEAELHQPHSIELDANGNLFIADISNHRIRRVDLATGLIETFAGTGAQEPTPDGAPLSETPLNGPRTLAFRPPHDLYVALREGNAVYRIDLESETIHHVAGSGELGFSGDGGPATAAALAGPKGMALAPDGAIYLADTENHAIRRIATDGRIETVAGDGTAHDGPDGDPLQCGLARPHGVFVDHAGRVFIGDSENHRVRLLSAGSD